MNITDGQLQELYKGDHQGYLVSKVLAKSCDNGDLNEDEKNAARSELSNRLQACVKGELV